MTKDKNGKYKNKGWGMSLYTYIHTDRGYLIGPSPSGGPKATPLFLAASF